MTDQEAKARIEKVIGKEIKEGISATCHDSCENMVY